MSAARRSELADEDPYIQIHPETYRHKYTVHQPYMSFLLEHVLRAEEEIRPSNLSLYEEIDGKMQRRNYHPPQAVMRAQLVNQALRLGLYQNFNWHPTKQTWHLLPISQDFKHAYMPDGVNFTPTARDTLEKMSFRGQTLLTSQQIDKLQRFLASCLAYRDTAH